MRQTIITIFLSVGVIQFASAQVTEEISLGLGNARIVQYSPASDLIAIAVGKKVKLFRSGIQVASLSANNGKIQAMKFDPEGELMMTGHSNGKINIWNVKTLELQSDFQANNHEILDCDFLDSKEKIAVLTKKKLSVCSLNGDLLAESYNHFGDNTALAVSENGEEIATADSDNGISIWNDKAEHLARLENIHKTVLTMDYNPKGEILATGGIDGTIDLWDTKNKNLIKTLLDTHGRINSLEFSNDGKYLAAGSEYFFILSMSVEHPDVVYKKLKGAVLSSSFNPNGKEVCFIEDLTPHADIINISDLKIPPVFKFRDEGDMIAPQIYVSNPPKIVNNRINFTAGMIDIQGSIFDDYGVRGLNINGVETPIKENGKFIIHLPLTMGENEISLEAKDINGNIALKRFIINRKSDTDSYDPLVAKNYLFVVGIDDYQHWPQLNNAVQDGNDLATIMMGDYDFKFSDITFLKNEQATRNNVYKGLRSMIEKVTPRDNLMIYFSGHGHFDELLNEGYWIPADAEMESPGDYLSNSSILKIIENINTQHTFLVADACFSGSLFSNSQRRGYYEKVDRFKSRWGLASGRLEVVSDGEIGANSPFARILLSFLKENQKEEFSVSELIQHVKIKVSELTDQTPIGNPLRIRGDEGGEFVFRKSGYLPITSSSK